MGLLDAQGELVLFNRVAGVGANEVDCRQRRGDKLVVIVFRRRVWLGLSRRRLNWRRVDELGRNFTPPFCDDRVWGEKLANDARSLAWSFDFVSINITGGVASR